MTETEVNVMRQAFEAAHSILIVSHIRPDGDAIGSLIALGLALQHSGKNVQMVLSDGVPSSFRFLEGSSRVRTQPEGGFDLIAVVDCSELGRVENAPNGVLAEGIVPDINIDHHVTNTRFARINHIVEDAVATCEILTELIPALGLTITPAVANALLAGIITDTLGFRVAGMRPKTLRISADLMEAGANLHEIYRFSLLQRSFQAARYWGAGLSTLQREGRMLWAVLSVADRRAVGYSGRDDADLINVLSSIHDIDISLIFVEQTDGRVKISWRAQPGYDVSKVATQFGGGGHVAASGAEIAGSLEEVQRAVLAATRRLLQ